MAPSNQASPNRRLSRASSKRRVRALGGRAKPGLAVDTGVSRHKAPPPQQVFPYETQPKPTYPYESRTQEQGFVKLSDVKALKSKKGSLKAQLENNEPVRPAIARSTTDTTQQALAASARMMQAPTRPTFGRSQTTAHAVRRQPSSAQVQPMHQRIKGLRPSPLDLKLTDISPSDRAIPIGITVPSASLSNHTISPPATTPTIIITPAREDFENRSPELLHAGSYRPASSVYSRYTSCAPRTARHEETPPVPPLPLFASAPSQKTAARESTMTVFEEQQAQSKGHKAHLSICTVFEEDSAVEGSRALDPKRLTSHSMLPTPRRSRGWWNVITSPFSANGFLFRSPTDAEAQDPDKLSMLKNAAEMARSKPAFAERTVDDDDLRSAPPTESQLPELVASKPLPKRSITAPGALDTSGAPVNIYRVPSQGEAAAYYDQTRHFPSVMMMPEANVSRSVFEDDSPVTDVCCCGHGAHEKHTYGDQVDDDECPVHGCFSDDSSSCCSESSLEEEELHGNPTATRGPFDDSHEFEQPKPPFAGGAAAFSTPGTAELKTPARPANERSLTDGTEQTMSPLSATPVVEDAHIATFMGPHSTHAEQREVTVTPGRTPTTSPPSSRDGPPVPALPPMHPMTSREVAGLPRTRNMSIDEKRPYRPVHVRNDSYGLGISDGEKELFPPPKPLRKLGTDKWGQLTVRELDEERAPTRPWYKRFLWPLVSLLALLLTLTIVVLVMYVPHSHADMPVQAQWLNLTGFPPLPTGVATVGQPKPVTEESGCVSPPRLWSCGMPAGSLSSQPDFRLEIRFRNGTLASNETVPVPANSTLSQRSLAARDSWTSSLFAASPAPPTQDDQLFIGQTTDNISVPYDGEETPFYISLLDTKALVEPAHKLIKRQSEVYPYPTPSIASNSSNAADSASNSTVGAAKSIPKPMTLSNGKPAAADLYPLVTAQPLRLYNRGQENEHYGFYTYFDRSLYVSNLTAAGSWVSIAGADVALTDANALCTWSQTRMRVQIWTRKGTVGQLSNTGAADTPAINSTANDLTGSGSFPYPITVTLDRHGGNAGDKGAYCYGIDENQHVLDDVKMWVYENRAFGGALVSAAEVPTNNGTLSKRSDSYSGSGIDGGTGGCACQWAS